MSKPMMFRAKPKHILPQREMEVVSGKVDDFDPEERRHLMGCDACLDSFIEALRERRRESKEAER